MPNPKKFKTRKDFIGACIPIVLKEGTAKTKEQAAAVCFSMWKNRNKKNKSKAIIEGIIDYSFDENDILLCLDEYKAKKAIEKL